MRLRLLRIGLSAVSTAARAPGSRTVAAVPAAGPIGSLAQASSLRSRLRAVSQFPAKPRPLRAQSRRSFPGSARRPPGDARSFPGGARRLPSGTRRLPGGARSFPGGARSAGSPCRRPGTGCLAPGN